MATIDRRPNGKWRAQVRREGHVLSKTFVMKGDADAWVRETDRSIDKGEDPTARRLAADGTFGSLVDQHIDDLTTYGKQLRRSKDAALA
ncbi:MAG TPA: site-specific integrase, partial [Hyphomonadaceae bacterium]|nr:site-specific integrase [Hyphomonadaceae bacterium]